MSVFVDCPAEIRLKRRSQRDMVKRGRTIPSVRQQFAERVVPMYERFVAPQALWADLQLSGVPTRA